MKQIDMNGDDWVLINWDTKDCVMDPSGKGPIAFLSQSDAEKFKRLHNLETFTPAKVSQLSHN